PATDTPRTPPPSLHAALPIYAALASPARHVDIVGAGLFQRQPDEFAAALDRGPVIELVAHRDRPRADGCGPADHRPSASRVENPDRKSTRLNSSHVASSYAVC